MNNKQELVIFDFCDTLFNGQSVNFFINYLINQQNFTTKLYLKIRKTFATFFISNSKAKKEFILKPFTGKSYDYFKNISTLFFNHVIQQRLHKKIIAILKKHQLNNDRIIVVSGGFSIYLDEFGKQYNSQIVATELQFINNIFTGKINSNECLGEEKIKRLLLIDKINEQELKSATFYTDHKSDLPLLEIVNKGYIIKHNQDIGWAGKKYTEITL